MFPVDVGVDQHLDRARRRAEHAVRGWLSEPPPGSQRMSWGARVLPLPQRGPFGGEEPTAVITPDVLTAHGNSLLQWDLHRRAGLRVETDGPAEPGRTFVLGVRTGPLWLVAPYRVVEVEVGENRIGVSYSTLKGNLAMGIERLSFEIDEGGLSFEVDTVGKNTMWPGRLVPPVARLIQQALTRRYITAACDQTITEYRKSS